MSEQGNDQGCIAGEMCCGDAEHCRGPVGRPEPEPEPEPV